MAVNKISNSEAYNRKVTARLVMSISPPISIDQYKEQQFLYNTHKIMYYIISTDAQEHKDTVESHYLFL